MNIVISPEADSHIARNRPTSSRSTARATKARNRLADLRAADTAERIFTSTPGISYGGLLAALRSDGEVSPGSIPPAISILAGRLRVRSQAGQ